MGIPLPTGDHGGALPGRQFARLVLGDPPLDATPPKRHASRAMTAGPGSTTEAYGGSCTCRVVRYELTSAPLFVHSCHCRWCQRETGAAFALNALIEADRVRSLASDVELVHTPSNSGKGQQIARCPNCRVAVWSHYAGAGALVRFVRVGTLEEPDRWPPNIHIYTASKQPWLTLPEGVPAVPEYYRRSQHWPAASLERWDVLFPRTH